jgi:hypothetical protein
MTGTRTVGGSALFWAVEISDGFAGGNGAGATGAGAGALGAGAGVDGAGAGAGVGSFAISAVPFQVRILRGGSVPRMACPINVGLAGGSGAGDAGAGLGAGAGVLGAGPAGAGVGVGSFAIG